MGTSQAKSAGLPLAVEEVLRGAVERECPHKSGWRPPSRTRSRANGLTFYDEEVTGQLSPDADEKRPMLATGVGDDARRVFATGPRRSA